MNEISLTTLIAVYGAILSSVLLGWNIYRDLTNKGKLRVHCNIGKLITSGAPKDENDYLFYNITNVGKKPILVTTIGGRTKEHDFMINPRGLPKMLGPGEYLIEYSPDLSILNENLLGLCAIDSLGKVYKVKRRVLKNLVKRAKKISKQRYNTW